MRRVLLLALLGGALASTAGCGAMDEIAGQDCIILANGGNKLCGDDAKTWCDTTDNVRKSAEEFATDPEFGDPGTASSVRDSQAACDAIRGT